jgi:hypothetical protein
MEFLMLKRPVKILLILTSLGTLGTATIKILDLFNKSADATTKGVAIYHSATGETAREAAQAKAAEAKAEVDKETKPLQDKLLAKGLGNIRPSNTDINTATGKDRVKLIEDRQKAAFDLLQKDAKANGNLGTTLNLQIDAYEKALACRIDKTCDVALFDEKLQSEMCRADRSYHLWVMKMQNETPMYSRFLDYVKASCASTPTERTEAAAQ